VSHLEGIVAVELLLDRIEAKGKLSQNRDGKKITSVEKHLTSMYNEHAVEVVNEKNKT
jgi:predicted FMN-binding regulatory protein PaiB